MGHRVGWGKGAGWGVGTTWVGETMDFHCMQTMPTALEQLTL